MLRTLGKHCSHRIQQTTKFKYFPPPLWFLHKLWLQCTIMGLNSLDFSGLAKSSLSAWAWKCLRKTDPWTKSLGLAMTAITEVLEPLPLISALLWRAGQMFKCESSHRILIFLAKLCFPSKLKTTGVAGLSVNSQIPSKQSHPPPFISLSSSGFCYPFGNCSFIWFGGPPSEPEPFVLVRVCSRGYQSLH